MHSQKLYQTVRAAVFCALVFLGSLVSFPAPAGGNLNLGDGFILTSILFLSTPWAILASAVGASLADLATGYLLYLPATLLIKAGMTFLAALLFKSFTKLHLHKIITVILTALFSELFMTLGYYLYESALLHSFVSPLLNLPSNLMQTAFAALLFTLSALARKG